MSNPEKPKEFFKTPYLIQRCMLRDGADKSIDGFDSVFKCDYMGSAEFEFGHLPQSLRRVVTRKYMVRPSGLKKGGVDLMLVCHSEEQRRNVEAFLPKLATRSVRLKEHSYLKEVLAGGDRYVKDFCLWWDIVNDWFLCLDQRVADLLLKAIDALAKKWGAK